MNKMSKEIFNLIDCPRNCEGCIGLLVSANGSGIEVQQGEDGYIVKTREGDKARGTCTHYQECYGEHVGQMGPLRKPATSISSYVIPFNDPKAGKILASSQKS